MERKIAVSLLSELFEPAVCSFDRGLNRTLIEAVKKDMGVVKFTLSGEISLDREFVPDEEVTGYHEDREAIIPAVKYKTDFVMQTKDSSSGSIPKGYELYYDEESGSIKARKEENGQTSLFEAEKETLTYEVGAGGVITNVEFNDAPKIIDEYPDYAAEPDEADSELDGADDAGDD